MFQTTRNNKDENLEAEILSYRFGEVCSGLNFNILLQKI